MSEEITSIVKTTSNGNVKITLEQYESLLAKAAEKAPVIYRTVQKTPAMVAADNKTWGIVFMGGGLTFTTIGAFMYKIGRAQAKAL